MAAAVVSQCTDSQRVALAAVAEAARPARAAERIAPLLGLVGRLVGSNAAAARVGETVGFRAPLAGWALGPGNSLPVDFGEKIACADMSVAVILVGLLPAC